MQTPSQSMPNRHTPIIQQVFAQLLTLSASLTQIIHHHFFNPTDNPIARATMITKITTITIIITSFCWGQLGHKLSDPMSV